MLELTPIFVLAIIFGFIYGIVYLGVKRKERQYMIDKGVDPSVFTELKPGMAAIRYGLLLIGVAVGILVGNILDATTVLEEEVSYFSMIFLFGGLALVISYFLEKHQAKKE